MRDVHVGYVCHVQCNVCRALRRFPVAVEIEDHAAGLEIADLLDVWTAKLVEVLVNALCRLAPARVQTGPGAIGLGQSK